MADLIAESPIAVAEVMLGRALAAVEACEESDEITESFTFLWELAWDECCGTLAATPSRVYRSQIFPQPIGDETNCQYAQLCVDVAIILLRCLPVVDENGTAPEPAAIEEASMKAGRDAALIMDSVTASLPEGWERANVEQTFDGGGGCIAVVTEFTIGLPQDEWCDTCG